MSKKQRSGGIDDELVAKASALGIEHSQYKQYEEQFIDRQLGRHFRRLDPRNEGRAYIKTLRITVKELETTTAPSLSSDARRVFHAIQRVGFAAVHPVSGWEGYLLPSQISEEDKVTADQLRNRVRELVWKRVERWYQDAHSVIHEQRKQGAELLKRLGAELAGDRRGHGTASIVDPVDIARAYYNRLFRLRCAMEELRREMNDSPLRKALRVAYAFGFVEPYPPRRIWT